MAISTKKVTGDESVHYVPPRKKRKESNPASMQPPLTPMIDVTFQLLLFFVLTLTFREAEGLIPGTLPGPDAETPPSVIQPVHVIVKPVSLIGFEFEIKGEHFAIKSGEELYLKLAGKMKACGSEDMPLIIEPHGNVLWEHVVNVFNQAVRAKIKNIGFAQSR